VPSEEVK